MKKIFTYLVILMMSIPFLHAQLDTIAGPFSATNPMITYENKIYVTASVNEFDPLEIFAIDVNDSDFSAVSVFTHPFGYNAVGGVYVDEENLYLSTTGGTVSNGIVYRVSDVNGDNPITEVYLEFPWLPTHLTVKDSVMYIGKFFFFGGGIFTYDMTDPDAEITPFFEGNTNNLNDFIFYQDQILISDATDGQILTLDADLASPVTSAVIDDLDFPTGIAIDEDNLYVSVGNYNSNSGSRVNVYDMSTGSPFVFVESQATDAALAIIDVARINGSTYILESSEEQPAYLLRVQDVLNPTDTFEEQKIDAYPNPTSNLLTFNNLMPNSVMVIDISGKSVLSVTGPLHQIDLSNLPSGIYNLLIEKEKGEFSSLRVVKE